ncbi:glycosyltransferase family 4 protein [Conexibacter arvalis]|uniref:Glycosyltransferase involved in cell wall biosynthesis n=1 Tax=Conexibacter arvalis TaxID=912552 RepID=A0A840IC93_9ACTN|nr:glycosyltransferase family 4 protein [Conexibacter arvalis]MBB4661678.1 glycosyltransferase involved in cell wall biosynthesis [Conexibacter arvalis]
MSERSLVQVTLWNSPYLGNVMTSQLALAATVRRELGLGTHFVLADGAAGQPWLADLEAAGTTWSVLPPRRGWKAHLARAVRDHDAALVHTHFTAADLAGARVATAAGIPCVWHVRTGFNGYPPRQRAKDLVKMRLVARRDVARIVAVSPWLGELVRRRGAPAERVEVVPNAIVLSRFDRMPSRAAARERFGLSEEASVVVALGWWPEVKGVDVLLDALDEVLARRADVELLLVGEQRMRDFLAARSPRDPSWLRRSGFVEDSAWLFAAGDLFVSASRHEGQSSAIGEAIGCGLPVVMSDIPGTAGWAAAPGVEIFPSEDAELLATRLEEQLATPPPERAAIADANRRWARETVGIETWCERLCGLYRELLWSGRRPPISRRRGGRSPRARRRCRRA